MGVIGEQEIFSLLEKISVIMEDASLDYMVYGSVGYAALTGDKVDIHDLDIIVRQFDFALLPSLLGRPDSP